MDYGLWLYFPYMSKLKMYTVVRKRKMKRTLVRSPNVRSVRMFMFMRGNY